MVASNLLVACIRIRSRIKLYAWVHWTWHTHMSCVRVSTLPKIRMWFKSDSHVCNVRIPSNYYLVLEYLRVVYTILFWTSLRGCLTFMLVLFLLRETNQIQLASLNFTSILYFSHCHIHYRANIKSLAEEDGRGISY